ncbi:hypothetical protein San01_38250 [Streptomyces angustmyceticus]|uniref:Uncharacterized protein n=1 Tax=Streptomyces angustmyceticus TaxID=285578 RepID=A0A5J4LL15_9ACTN|nr:hypothetical protein San01_38250 [Streptomyces angustmyceticus]
MQTLDRDLAPKDFVPGTPDGAHTALAYPLNQAIPPGDQSPLVHRRRLRHRTPLRKPVRIQGATIVAPAGGKPSPHRAPAQVFVREPEAPGHMRSHEGFRDPPGASRGRRRKISGICQGFHGCPTSPAQVTMGP